MKNITDIAKQSLPAFSVFILCFSCFATIGSSGYAQPVNTPNTSESKFNNTDKELENLITTAIKLRSEGKLAEAADMQEKIVAITELRFGFNHTFVATTLTYLAGLYQEQGKYTKAKPLYIRALGIQEKILGLDHKDVAITLNNLAELYRAQGNNKNAEPLYIRALAIYKKALDPDNPDVASILKNLCILYTSQGKYSNAEYLCIRSLAMGEKLLGSDHPTVASRLGTLAGVYHDQGKYSKAEPLYIRSLVIREKALGPDHLDVAVSLNNLALLYAYSGEFKKSELLYIRALGIQEKTLGPGHKDNAVTLNNLAELYRDQGENSKAELLYLETLAIYEKALGPLHPDVARGFNNLALLYRARGDNSKAELLYLEALAIYENALGPDHPDVATILNNLAELYTDQGRYRKAETLYIRSLTAMEKNLGFDHPTIALGLNNLAGLYHVQGKYSKAEPKYNRSLVIMEKTLGPYHPTVGRGLNNLAELYTDQGKYGKAESKYNRSLAIIEKALGPYHPRVAISLNNLSAYSFRKSDYPKGINYLKRSMLIQSAWLNRELPLLPEQNRSDQIKVFGAAWEIPFGIAEKLPAAKDLALNTRLNRQGLLQEIQQRQALLLSASGALKEKVQDLKGIIQQLSTVSLPQAKRAELNEQRNRLQSDIYRELPNLAIETVSIADVAKALPADSVLVEFQKYQPYDFSKSLYKQWVRAQYLALVLKPNGEITAINLGPAAVIDSTIHRGLTATSQGFSDAPEIWAKLSKQVLQPLLPHLSGSKQWFLSLDGELNRVPFAAIPAPQIPELPLAEAVQLRLITTGRELLRLQKLNANSTAALVMANPSYNLQTAVPSTESSLAVPAENQRRSAVIDSKQWQQLPATEQEGSQIASLLSSPLLSGTKATTTALLQQQGPKVLHIATHGFFVADQETKASNPLRAIQEDSLQVKGLRQEDPQLRSGLVLAGANQPTLDPNDDGYLTSAEALNLNLKGTELVVLSACSTGQGDVRTGEGVYGLQRSLTVAGARSTLLSLWKVDDAATAEFMVRFYKRLKAGEGRSDALAAVQKEFRDGAAGNGQWKEPYFWAAWQLVGDWKPINGL